MSLSTSDPRPPYQQAADLIRREIESGKIKPGEQVPSYRELQERFDIANMTARSALRVLRDEGLIYTVQGRGSYVADAAPAAGIKPGSKTSDQSDPGSGVSADELRALREQLRIMSADLQDIKREVAELKAAKPQAE
ncbi:hypothetical protein GCM10009801_08590 [Streptomyces albiaxialis]|uniref:HTH gntR-type domain-containing protein n=1 Tax=Streptomyces albiaxialis TaxID=329523 RepID=A0ABN2VJW5_9ACTN